MIQRSGHDPELDPELDPECASDPVVTGLVTLSADALAADVETYVGFSTFPVCFPRRRIKSYVSSL